MIIVKPVIPAGGAVTGFVVGKALGKTHTTSLLFAIIAAILSWGGAALLINLEFNKQHEALKNLNQAQANWLALEIQHQQTLYDSLPVNPTVQFPFAPMEKRKAGDDLNALKVLLANAGYQYVNGFAVK